ncbi:MAG: DUF4124 domain-containing protein [Gammaproteobacteria bacterium]|nr:DUF4124 domain-containing protein [Gammaproteobacteria bacterium]
MKNYLFILSFLLISSAYGQTMYKCPDPSGNVKFQQMPCTPTGGGESMEIKSIKTTGADTRISAEGRAYMQDNAARRSSEQEERRKEAERREALNVEREKARAAREQAEAQRETARAIWATGRY